MVEPVPEQIRKVFGVPAGHFAAEPGFVGRWRCGDVVCSRVDDATLATASARARETLELAGLAVARPLRGSDGRYVVGGWRADRYPHTPALQHPDEVIALAGSLPPLLGEAAPLRQRRSTVPWRAAEVFDRAFTASWHGDLSHDLDAGLEANMGSGAAGFQAHRAEALVAAAGMARLRDRLQAHVPATAVTSGEAQVAHIDMVRSVRMGGPQPLIVDVLLRAAPTVCGQAIAAVDLVAAGAGAEDLLWRWSHLDRWAEHLAAAIAFRLGVHAVHPGAVSEAYMGLRAAAGTVERFVRSAHGI